MGEEKSISIVMLVYNEVEIIEHVIREYYETVYQKLHDAEFIIAEDGSTDGTKEILNRLANELDVRLVSGDARKGYVKAFRDSISLPQKSTYSLLTPVGNTFQKIFGPCILLQNNMIL